ncbi:MAG: aminotransferase class III-fold pyridoxal phosphate-dependent enzyme [Pseudomonadota bacterium]
MNKIRTQDEWLARAREVLPAGGFGNFAPDIVIKKGDGAYVWDADGNKYIDFLIGSGPMLLGHGHPEVMEAVLEQLPNGMTFFANNDAGIELAEEICRAVPSAEMLRYVSTGGEADMYAIRLARAYTGRTKVMKFEGGYHGMSAEAQQSLAPTKLVNFPQAVPDSAGIPQSVSDEMLIAPFNDPDFAKSLIAEHGSEIACIIVEPLQRIIPPEPGFLQLLRDECDKHGIVLIFDEVVTGFRFAYGGAQDLYGVTPDLTTLGKVIGGGFPLAATVGKREIMEHFDKAIVGAEGWLMQLGTLSGNPVASVAGLKTLEVLRRDGMYEKLRADGETLMDAQASALSHAGIAAQIVGDATLHEVVFTDKPVRNYRDVLAQDKSRTAAWNHSLRASGIFKSPGKLYPNFALSDQDLETAVEAFGIAATKLHAA